MSSLEFIKQNLKIDVPNDPVLQKKKELLEKLLKDEGDCFGTDYEPDNEDCKNCLILADLEGRKEPVNVFCKEIFYQNKDVLTVEIKEPEVTQPEDAKEPEAVKSLKPKLEKKAPLQTEEWKLELRQMVEEVIDKDTIYNKICSKYNLDKALVGRTYAGYRATRSRYPSKK